MGRKNIGLFVNRKKDKELKITGKLVNLILKYGMTPLLPRSISDDLGLREGYTESEMLGMSSFLISIGGDGTLLNMARTSYSMIFRCSELILVLLDFSQTWRLTK